MKLKQWLYRAVQGMGKNIEIDSLLRVETCKLLHTQIIKNSTNVPWYYSGVVVVVKGLGLHESSSVRPIN